MLNIDDLDESLIQQLSQRAGDWGFESVEKFLKAIAADPKKFAMGVSTSSKRVLFQLKFECTEEFVARFDRKAQSDNRTRTGQAKQLVEDYAGMKALPTVA